jgi:hypothetical protein
VAKYFLKKKFPIIAKHDESSSFQAFFSMAHNSEDEVAAMLLGDGSLGAHGRAAQVTEVRHGRRGIAASSK